jgi:catalase
MRKALTDEGAIVNVVAPHGGFIAGAKGEQICVAHSLLNAASVLFDAVYIPGGADSVKALLANVKTVHFVNEMYKHGKAIAATGEGLDLICAASIQIGKDSPKDPALILDENADAKNIAAKFIKAIAQHRNWEREKFAMTNTPA